MYFEWREEYRTGIDAIDKQHRHLLEIGAKIFDLAILTMVTTIMMK